MTNLETVLLARAKEQADKAKIVRYERDHSPLEVDQRRYRLERHQYRCRWCGARHRSASVQYCGKCGNTPQPCVDCGGPVRRGSHGRGAQACRECREVYQPTRSK